MNIHELAMMVNLGNKTENSFTDFHSQPVELSASCTVATATIYDHGMVRGTKKKRESWMNNCGNDM